jgi:hypothetical protein
MAYDPNDDLNNTAYGAPSYKDVVNYKKEINTPATAPNISSLSSVNSLKPTNQEVSNYTPSVTPTNNSEYYTLKELNKNALGDNPNITTPRNTLPQGVQKLSLSDPLRLSYNSEADRQRYEPGGSQDQEFARRNRELSDSLNLKYLQSLQGSQAASPAELAAAQARVSQSGINATNLAGHQMKLQEAIKGQELKNAGGLAEANVQANSAANVAGIQGQTSRDVAESQGKYHVAGISEGGDQARQTFGYEQTYPKVSSDMMGGKTIVQSSPGQITTANMNDKGGVGAPVTTKLDSLNMANFKAPEGTNFNDPASISKLPDNIKKMHENYLILLNSGKPIVNSQIVSFAKANGLPLVRKN